ncbi:KAP family NTPase, partial [Clostridium perfringens]|uniref:KAP family P-loop NTPase fold protein n=1 Tax=Clostridium perfringens TaxID=1502 RepID=UPI0022453E0C
MEKINLEELTFEKDDLLNRKQIAINLTNIIKNKSNLNVLAIDSSWGTGKTTFINKWIDMLNNDYNYKDQFSILYFNAWKNDYIKDPFMALMTEIELNTSSDFKEAFKEAMTVGKKICKSALNISLKLATAGAVGTDDIKANEIKSSVLKCIIDEKNDREEFIEKLENLACEDKKIIFFIDEIDRCRPTFAIELLEVIKHLFSAKNIFFVISLDK